jgi:4-hydroxybenzoate polyprenyltransferase
VLLYGAGIAWTLFYDTIYAHQDRDDDALIGVKSTARLFGRNTRPWLAAFHITATVLVALAILACRPTPVSAAIAVAGLIGFAAHLAHQLRRLDVDDPASCLAIFRSNRDAGLILAVGLALAAGAATLASP